MNFSKVLGDLAGQSGSGFNTFKSKIPGGLAGGAVAGGVVAMLMGNKTLRKTAGKAAGYGGAAVLGGLAYRAYKNWQDSDRPQMQQAAGGEYNYASAQRPSIPDFEKEALQHANGAEPSRNFHLALIKAMIAAARADGNIDAQEQAKISEAIDNMNLDNTAKSELLELFIKPIAISDFVSDLQTTEQKAEIYLASCLAIELDHQKEYAHLSNLSNALALPAGLEQELRVRAASVM